MAQLVEFDNLLNGGDFPAAAHHADASTDCGQKFARQSIRRHRIMLNRSAHAANHQSCVISKLPDSMTTS